MSVEWKLKTLAEYIGADDINEIANVDDLMYDTNDATFLVLTETERKNLAWDNLYYGHDDNWYDAEQLSKFLAIEKEELELMFVKDVLMDDQAVLKLNGTFRIQGHKINSLIDSIMDFPTFIDYCFNWHNEKNDIGMIISEDNETIKNELYIYKVDGM